MTLRNQTVTNEVNLMDYNAIEKLGANAQRVLEDRNGTYEFLIEEKSLPTFSARQLSDMIGIVSHTKVTKFLNEEEAKRGKPWSRVKNSERFCLTIEEAREAARLLGCKPYRDKRNGAFVLNIQNLKGGAGKSLSSSMLAEGITLLPTYLLEERRTLLIDLDPQGTATVQLYGNYMPKEEDLSALLLMAQEHSLEEIKAQSIKKTSIPNLDLIPASTLDAHLASELTDPDFLGDLNPFELLKERVIKPLRNSYDLIILDAGPHMDIVARNCMFAADGMTIPVPPTYYSFDSSLKYIERFPEEFNLLKEEGHDASNLKFINCFINKEVMTNRAFDATVNDRAERELVDVFGVSNVLTALPLEIVYERCSELGGTVFSIPPALYEGDRKSYDRAKLSAVKWLKHLVNCIDDAHSKCEARG